MEYELTRFTYKAENNLQHKIKEVYQQINKKEQELKRLKEKLIYLNCELVEENNKDEVYDNGKDNCIDDGINDDNDNRNDNRKDIKSKLLLSGFGDEQMRSFML